MKLVTNKFKSGGLHEKDVVATWNLGSHLSIIIIIIIIKVFSHWKNIILLDFRSTVVRAFQCASK